MRASKAQGARSSTIEGHRKLTEYINECYSVTTSFQKLTDQIQKMKLFYELFLVLFHAVD